MSLKKKVTKRNIDTTINNIVLTPQYNLDSRVPSSIPKMFQMGLFNQLYRQLEINKKYLNIPISLEMLIPMIYQHRIINIRIALLLWCNVETIKRYKNNNNDEMRFMLNHTIRSISSYLYLPLIPENKYKSFIKKILKIIKKLITNSINQIRKSGDAKECEEEYEKCSSFFNTNPLSNHESNKLTKLVKLYFKACKINHNYPEIRMNLLLYQKAEKHLRKWLHMELLKHKPTSVLNKKRKKYKRSESGPSVSQNSFNTQILDSWQ